MTGWIQQLGRSVLLGLREFGLAAMVLWETLGWIVLGPSRSQPVRIAHILHEAIDIGVRALGILGILSFATGAMLAVQGVYSLQAFGAERQVTLGLAISVTREFGPLMTGILVAGRSGSALAARISTMIIREEVDALTVIGINPLRQLVAPALIAMVVMLPCLVWFADLMALLGGGLYLGAELGITMSAYIADVKAAIGTHDITHGLFKSCFFAILITLVGVVNGMGVTGGAEGVGHATTRAVVHAISAIVITDMIFVYLATR